MKTKEMYKKRLVAAKDSVDAAVAVVLSEQGGIFTLEQKQH